MNANKGRVKQFQCRYCNVWQPFAGKVTVEKIAGQCTTWGECDVPNCSVSTGYSPVKAIRYVKPQE